MGSRKLAHAETCVYDFDPTDKDKRRLICMYNPGHKMYILDLWREQRFREMLKTKHLRGSALQVAEAIVALDI